MQGPLQVTRRACAKPISSRVWGWWRLSERGRFEGHGESRVIDDGVSFLISMTPVEMELLGKGSGWPAYLSVVSLSRLVPTDLSLCSCFVFVFPCSVGSPTPTCISEN
jgi:hypothetical protein